MCTEIFKLKERLTEEHYQHFAPLLSDDLERATLARGVVESRLPDLGYSDLQGAWRLLAERHASDPDGLDEEWIPELVGRIGFERLASQVRQAATEHRATRQQELRDAQGEFVPVLFPPRELEPFLFRRHEAIGWLLRYQRPEDGAFEEGVVKKDIPSLRYCHQIMQTAPRRLEWQELWGPPPRTASGEPMPDPFRIESSFTRDLALDEQAYADIKREVERLEARLKRMNDGLESGTVEERAELVRQIECCRKEMRSHRIKLKSQGMPAQDKARNKVRQYLSRTRKALREQGLLGLAEHLERAFDLTSDGVLYRPPEDAPRWQF